MIERNVYRRMEWLDIAKAIGMFFIVLGHVCIADINAPLRVFCYSFNAQMFFLLSGITFLGIKPISYDKVSIISVRTQIELWGKRLILPYLIFGGISILLYFFMGSLGVIEGEDVRILPNLVGMFYGNSKSEYFQWNRPLWFLPCLVLTYMLWLLVIKMIYKVERSKKEEILLYFIFIIGVFSVGFLFEPLCRGIQLPFHMETVVFVFPFVGIGIIYKNYLLEQIGLIKNSMKLVLGIIFLMMSLNLGSATWLTNLRQEQFHGYLRFYTVSILVSVAIIFFSYAIKQNALLEYVGKRTLPILLMHKFPVLFFQKMCPWIKTEIAKGSVIIEVLVTIITIFMCIIAGAIIEKYIPWSIGVKRNDNKINN